MKKIFPKIICLFLSLYLLIALLPVNSKAASEPELTAPSAVLIEESSGQILFAKNENEQRACASITKIMTLILVFESIESGKLSLTDELTTSEHAASMGGSDIWLKKGEIMSVDDLIKAVCVVSANDAAVVLAEAIATTEEAFVDQMNEKAQKLGMTNTVFKNCNGLDEDGHISSAYDVALMSTELIKHKKIYDYSGIWLDYLRQGKTQIVSTNKMLKTYPGITGLKTGTTSKAGSCICATAQKNNMGLIAVVLGCANSTDRFSDASKLLDYGFSNYISFTPEITDQPESAEIENGMKKTVGLTYEKAKQIIIKKEDKSKVKTQLSIYDGLNAPIYEGQQIGEFAFLLDDKVIDKTAVNASEDIEAIDFKNLLLLIAKSLVTA